MKKFKLDRKTVSSLALAFVLLCFVVFYIVESFAEFQAYSKEDVVVHFVDVGQGDCTVITTPEGNIIIDAGLYDEVERTVSYIDSIGVNDFKYAIFTHPHSDHIGGAGSIISNYNVDTVILPNVVSTYTPFEKMLEAIEKKDCNVLEGKAGVSLELGKVRIDLLAPVYEYEDINNMSIATKITYGEVSFLFTGDAEEISELAMLERGEKILDSTILKVGHHGSSSSSCYDFIKAVSPEVAVYSCGINNEYGHPHGQVIKRINNIGAVSYRTDKQGSIVISTDGQRYYVNAQK